MCFFHFSSPLRKWSGAHTDLSVATIVASGHSGCYSSPIASAEKSGYLPPDDDALSLVASDTELALDHSPRKGHVPTSDPSTVASSLHQLKKLYDLEEKVGLPLGDFMADSLNVMGRQHLEKSSLEDMLGRQLRPANIDLQLKQVNEEIYSRQGGQMSNARGKDGSLKRINNVLQKAMIPLMRVADICTEAEAEAPSMKAVFDQCMTSLTLLSEANLEVETLRREAFKPTTPHLYKSLITKPGESKTLLFGDHMEEHMKSLETKEKLQKALAPDKAPSRKTWSQPAAKRPHPYGKAATSQRETKNVKGFPKPNVSTASGKPAYSRKKWYSKK